MALLRPKTFWQRPADVERRWYFIDATDQTLGRLSVRIARTLMGKDQPTYTPGVDCGDFVVVTNLSKVRVSGRKRAQKVYRHHTGYIGGLKEIPFEELMGRKPERVFELAVRRMLPKSNLGKRLLKRLKVYAGPEHPHAAQQPKPLPEHSLSV